MEYVIELDKVTRRYPGFLLDHVSFQVPKGCIMGFVGENGAGKSTTLKAILGLISIDEGTVRVFGQKLKDDGRLREDIGVVLDECCFPEQLTVKQTNLFMGYIFKNWDSALFAGYVKRLGLAENKTVKEFSRGMKMKLQIAAALAHRPKLLIMDQATSGLDPIVRDEILELFQEFIEDEDHTILMSTHITGDLEKIADYITCIHKGKLLFSENKDELLERYGIVHCGQSDYEKLNPEYVKRVRKGEFGYEVLVNNRENCAPRSGSLVVDRASIDEIMLLLVKGRRMDGREEE